MFAPVALLPTSRPPLAVNPAGGLSAVTFVGTIVQDVVVTGNTVQNLVVGALNLFDISGTLTNLGILPPNAVGDVSLLFSSPDTDTTALAPVAGNGTFMARVAAGSYLVSALIAEGEDLDSDGIPENLTAAASLYNIGSLVVAGNSGGNNFSIPPLSAVSGTVTQTELSPSGLAVPEGTSVIARDSLFPFDSVLRRCFPAAGGSFGDASDGSYSFPVVRGRDYFIGAVLPVLNLDTPEEGLWFMPVSGFGFIPADLVIINGDLTRNFHYPSLPNVVTISGTVTGPNGLPAANVSVDATSVGGLIGAPGTGFSAGSTTNGASQYSFQAFAGTPYFVDFRPLQPTPGGGGFPIPSNEVVKGSSPR